MANSCPSGMIIPPPMSPPARPIITPRTSGFDRTNRSPSTMSCHVCDADTRVITRRSLESRRSREMRNADTRNVRPSTQIGSSDCWWKRPEVVDVAEPLGDAGEDRVEHRADEERAVRGDEPERVRRRELLGILHDVRDRRVLRRAPQQREDLDQERDHDQPEQVVPERQHQSSRPATDVAADHHRSCGSSDRGAHRRSARTRTRAACGRSSRGRCRVSRTRDLRRDREDREEPGPVAEARDELRAEQREEARVRNTFQGAGGSDPGRGRTV